MVAKEIDRKATMKEQLTGAIACWVVFAVVYNFCGWYTSQSERVGEFFFDFERQIPFLPWMVIPYMSSGLFFVAVFFLGSSFSGLSVLVKRVVFITCMSGLFFLLIPLKCSFVRPETDAAFLNFFFQFLNTWDTPYNQAPSLHISYAFIFWSVLRHKLKGGLKIVAAVWLILMGISTLTIFQHHLIDIFASFLLVAVTFFIFSNLPPTSSSYPQT